MEQDPALTALARCPGRKGATDCQPTEPGSCRWPYPTS